MEKQDWDERYRNEELLWSAEPNRFVAEAVDGLDPGDALDLAGGEGRNAVWLAKQGWNVTVLDWSDVALDKGRALADREGVHVWFTQVDLRTWWPPEACTDLALIAYLQLPWEERHGVWRGAARSLRPGGRLIVIGHDSSNLVEGYGGPQSPEALYTSEEVVSVIGGSLRVHRAERVERPVETDDGDRIAYDNVVVADKSD